VWCIPDGGLVDNLNACVADLVGHTKKVSYIEWHPVAANVLLSASADVQVVMHYCSLPVDLILLQPFKY